MLRNKNSRAAPRSSLQKVLVTLFPAAFCGPMTDSEIGRRIYQRIETLFPYCRSITGDGVRETLKHLRAELPDIQVHEVPTGTKAFDWVVPNEWNIRDAYVVGPDGNKFCEFQKCNLHVLGYSTPVDKTVSLEELKEHLYSLPDQPDCIPFVSSFYKERWGFCITHDEFLQLQPGDYKVYIDSTLEPGHLTYGELVIPGETDEEILLSTYLCHPSMASDSLSGVSVTAELAHWLLGLERRRYTYRLLWIPETIGSIVYLSKHIDHLKAKVVAGFILTCIGDDRVYSFMPSRNGGTLADRAARHVLKNIYPGYITYDWRDRGSDERQYCSPGVDLPVASIFRSKYHHYPEYHTSKDDLDFVSPVGLFGGFAAFRNALLCLEYNRTYRTPILCEPHLGKYGLRSTITTMSFKSGQYAFSDGLVADVIGYADGERDLLDVADALDQRLWELGPLIERLCAEKLIEPV